MKKILLMAACVLMTLSVSAQKINVTGGSGKVPGYSDRVYAGLPFTVSVTGLNGTPQKWTAGIGSVSGQVIFHSSSTSVSNVIIDRTIDGNTAAIVSVYASNGNGVSRLLTVVPRCEASLTIFPDCVKNRIFASVTGVSDATSYTWSINSGSGGGTSTSSSRSFFVNGTGFYTVSVTINGGVCDGETISTSEYVFCDGEIQPYRPSGDDEPQLQEGLEPVEGIELFPNPTDKGEVQILLPAHEGAIAIELVTPEGKVMKQLSSESTNLTVDVRDLPSGVYYLRARGSNEYYETRRLVVE